MLLSRVYGRLDRRGSFLHNFEKNIKRNQGPGGGRGWGGGLRGGWYYRERFFIPVRKSSDDHSVCVPVQSRETCRRHELLEQDEQGLFLLLYPGFLHARLVIGREMGSSREPRPETASAVCECYTGTHGTTIRTKFGSGFSVTGPPVRRTRSNKKKKRIFFCRRCCPELWPN
jgi:hypothetical protein